MICRHCFRFDLAATDLFLAQRDGHWEMRCRKCVSVDFHFPDAGLTWLAPSTPDGPPEVSRLLASLRFNNTAGAPTTDDKFHGRRRDRYAFNLTAEYEDGEKHCVARVLNVSSGGAAWRGDRELVVGRRYRAHIFSHSIDLVSVDYRGEVEVARCAADGDGWLVGVQFYEPDVAATGDATLADVWYQRRHWKDLRHGRLLDFGSSRLSLIVNEELAPKEVVFLSIRGKQGIFRGQEVRGVMRVTSIEPISTDHFSVTVEFVKTRSINAADTGTPNRY
ncbi:hypothetical protein AGMMS49959_16290 [Planctomycetales bacterium]|nr:hypothetical protein AGMMS49959_16290 [Planctomycetales bacterium]